MINYTAALTTLMRDIVARVDALSFIDLDEVLVFGRFGRTGASGAFATCHTLGLPNSEPGYFYWRDRETGCITRRSPWFITKTPRVVLDGRDVRYLLSFALPRFCDQPFDGTRKEALYPGAPPWIARLDSVVHELYHIDPEQHGLRRLINHDGAPLEGYHSPEFFERVAELTTCYLESRPPAEVLEFLHCDFAGLERRYGGVVARTFRNYPSYPQRYQEPLDSQPDVAGVRVVPLTMPRQPTVYTESDLCLREFHAGGSRRIDAASIVVAA
jgi:hypothetical protein